MECVLLVGPPGSGKTTFYRTRFADTHEHVSKDAWPHTRSKERRQQEVLRRAFEEGRSVVVDNTQPAVRDRAPVVAVARSYGARVTAYVFETPIRECVARNRERTGRARVPAAAIFTAAKRFERPTMAEGFDALFGVRPSADGVFEVTAIAEARPAAAAEGAP